MNGKRVNVKLDEEGKLIVGEWKLEEFIKVLIVNSIHYCISFIFIVLLFVVFYLSFANQFV